MYLFIEHNGDVTLKTSFFTEVILTWNLVLDVVWIQNVNFRNVATARNIGEPLLNPDNQAPHKHTQTQSLH